MCTVRRVCPSECAGWRCASVGRAARSSQLWGCWGETRRACAREHALACLHTCSPTQIRAHVTSPWRRGTHGRNQRTLVTPAYRDLIPAGQVGTTDANCALARPG